MIHTSQCGFISVLFFVVAPFNDAFSWNTNSNSATDVEKLGFRSEISSLDVVSLGHGVSAVAA